MKFWDSSAIVALCLNEPASRRVRSQIESDADMITWWTSAVECASATARQRREGNLSNREAQEAQRVLSAIQERWYEVTPGGILRERAIRILRVHPLRAADALQLSAAIDWSGETARGDFVTLDNRLAEAAQLEGFNLPLQRFEEDFG